MLNENLKALRKQRGLSQEELAIRLHVVRQTISKWEKGLSVPDSDMLIKLAEILEVSVGELLGEPVNADAAESHHEITEQLIRLNEQFAIKNRRSKLILRIVLGVILGVIIINLGLIFFSYLSFNTFRNSTTTTMMEVEEVVEEVTEEGTD